MHTHKHTYNTHTNNNKKNITKKKIQVYQQLHVTVHIPDQTFLVMFTLAVQCGDTMLLTCTGEVTVSLHVREIRVHALSLHTAWNLRHSLNALL